MIVTLKDLNICVHSDTLLPIRPYLLIVPYPLRAIFFQTPQKGRERGKEGQRVGDRKELFSKMLVVTVNITPRTASGLFKEMPSLVFLFYL